MTQWLNEQHFQDEQFHFMFLKFSRLFFDILIL